MLLFADSVPSIGIIDSILFPEFQVITTIILKAQ